MIKNIALLVLALAIAIILLWSFFLNARKEAKRVPLISVHLPYGYCGDFAVFSGNEIDPIDQPPEYTHYNYYPKNDKDAVLIRLPYPYEDAKIQFIYDTREVEGILRSTSQIIGPLNTREVEGILRSTNPVLQYMSGEEVGGRTTLSETVKGGSFFTVPGENIEIGTFIYKIQSLDTCLTYSDLDRQNLPRHFRAVSGIN